MPRNIDAGLPSVVRACMSPAHRCWKDPKTKCFYVNAPAFSVVYVLSPRRPKGQRADLPDGGEKKPPSRLGDASSRHTRDERSDAHGESATSRLPTLPEEETSDPKSHRRAPMGREEADGKDDAAEVNVNNNSDVLYKSHTYKTEHAPLSSSSCRAW